MRFAATKNILHDPTKDPKSAQFEAGFALILCLLVLTIVVVVTVQFQASVQVEQRVAQAQASDETLALAARGAVYHAMALMAADQAGELTVGEYELQEVDTKAEAFLDPQATDARNINAAGDNSINGGSNDPFGNNNSPAVSNSPVSLEYTVEDMQGRFNLNWLKAENETFRNHAVAALKRLVTLIGHPEEFADTLVEFVQAEAEENTQTNGATANNTNTGTNEDDVPPRDMLTLNELFDIEDDNIVQILTGNDENNEPVEGVKPLLDFLTVWDTPGLNVNTAEPEIFAAWLPNADKRRPQPRQFSTQNRIQAAKQLVVYRLHLEGDENFEVGNEDANNDQNTDQNSDENNDQNTDQNQDQNTDQNTDQNGQENTGSDWIGTAPLKNLRDVAKLQSLRFLFSSTAGQGPQNRTTGAGAGATQANAGYQNWYDVMTFKSSLYRIKVTASQGDITKFYQAVVFRGDTSEDNSRRSVVLEWREVEE